MPFIRQESKCAEGELTTYSPLSVRPITAQSVTDTRGELATRNPVSLAVFTPVIIVILSLPPVMDTPVLSVPSIEHLRTSVNQQSRKSSPRLPEARIVPCTREVSR